MKNWEISTIGTVNLEIYATNAMPTEKRRMVEGYYTEPGTYTIFLADVAESFLPFLQNI